MSVQSKKARRKKINRRRKLHNDIIKLTAVMVSLMVVAAVVIIVSPKRSHTVIINHPGLSREVEIAAPPLIPQEGEQILHIETTWAVEDTATPEPTRESEAEATQQPEETPEPEPTQVPTAPPTAAAELLSAEATAETEFEYLPVFHKADTFDRKIAITVDDLYQVDNLQTIAQLAYKNKGKLTLFPVGENLSKHGMQETLKTCVFQLGFEVENHTWSHARIFKLPIEEMCREIWDQSQALNQTLGVNYQQHFFRFMGGDGCTDSRSHNYLKQLGFLGIADWSYSGSNADLDQIKAHLEPGVVYLFHTTDRDTAILKQFIPYVAQMGYEMVTLNELFGFEDNAMYQLTAPQPMPAPQPYAEDYRTHKLGEYAYNILLMQDKLRAMGLLEMEGESTGYYGEKTAEAIMQFQKQNGLTPTGVADAETQRKLLDSSAT